MPATSAPPAYANLVDGILARGGRGGDDADRSDRRAERSSVDAGVGAHLAPTGVAAPETRKARLLSEPGLLRVC
jgi:hypothetical protein